MLCSVTPPRNYQNCYQGGQKDKRRPDCSQKEEKKQKWEKIEDSVEMKALAFKTYGEAIGKIQAIDVGAVRVEWDTSSLMPTPAPTVTPSTLKSLLKAGVDLTMRGVITTNTKVSTPSYPWGLTRVVCWRKPKMFWKSEGLQNEHNSPGVSWSLGQVQDERPDEDYLTLKVIALLLAKLSRALV